MLLCHGVCENSIYEKFLTSDNSLPKGCKTYSISEEKKKELPQKKTLFYLYPRVTNINKYLLCLNKLNVL